MLPIFDNTSTGQRVTALTIKRVSGDVVWFVEPNAFQIHQEGLSKTYPNMAEGQKYLIHADDTRTVMDVATFNQQYSVVSK